MSQQTHSKAYGQPPTRMIPAVVLLILILTMTLTPVCAQTPEQEAEDMVTLSADITRWYPDDKVTAEGNVQATYKDYTITSQSAEADLNTNIAVFKGMVKLTTKQNVVEGEELTLNMKTREWTLGEASSQINLTGMDSRLKGMAFIHSAELHGGEKDVEIGSGSLTTCDLKHPHYAFNARDLQIYPGSRIVAHDVSLIGLDKRLFTLNSLVMPLTGMRHNLFPQVGSSADEGMFVKTSYGYAATADQQGFLKLDLMQKRGIGTGLEHNYKLISGAGQVSLYYLADRALGGNNITGQIQHNQKLGDFNLSLSSDYRTNNYLYYPGTTSQSRRINLSRAVGKSNTALSFTDYSNEGAGSTENITTSLRHSQQFSSKLSGVFSMDMRSFSSSYMPATDRELNSNIELRQRDKKFDIALVASKRTDLDDEAFIGDEFYSSLDRLPELTVETDSFRLGEKLFLGLPCRLSAGAGRYHEMPGSITKDRFLFEWDMMGKKFDLGKSTGLNVTAGFRQAYYAQDMAQYVLRMNTSLDSNIGSKLKARLYYNYQRPEGFSPFRFDYTGNYNYLRAGLDYLDSKKLNWSLSTGYDISHDQNPWQDLALRLSAQPNSKYGFSLSTGYDINRSQWRSLITRFQVNMPERLGLDAGLRYNIESGRLELARALVDYKINDLWRIEGVSSWNGVTKKFDYNSFRLTRDLHCWEVSLSYNDEVGFRTDRGFSLDFRIKAFPRNDRFGIGQFGQSIDSSMGEYYY